MQHRRPPSLCVCTQKRSRILECVCPVGVWYATRSRSPAISCVWLHIAEGADALETCERTYEEVQHRMSGLVLVIGNQNYSSWSMRPWVAMKHLGLDFEEVRIPLFARATRRRFCATRRLAGCRF